tara:strand:- start:538 stop:996 length:459 start_codon:yes stop_codon:yes gene_type:complete
MSNIVYSFLGMPVFSFSIARSGDWIDEHAAKHIDETANVIQTVKEGVMDINEPKNEAERAIAIYCDALLRYIIDKFRELYEVTPKRELPNVFEPMPVVVAGGTSLVKGYVERMRELIEENFPLPVSEVIHAEEPLFAVARGLYNAAEMEVSK